MFEAILISILFCARSAWSGARPGFSHNGFSTEKRSLNRDPGHACIRSKSVFETPKHALTVIRSTPKIQSTGVFSWEKQFWPWSGARSTISQNGFSAGRSCVERPNEVLTAIRVTSASGQNEILKLKNKLWPWSELRLLLVKVWFWSFTTSVDHDPGHAYIRSR